MYMQEPFSYKMFKILYYYKIFDIFVINKTEKGKNHAKVCVLKATHGNNGT